VAKALCQRWDWRTPAADSRRLRRVVCCSSWRSAGTAVAAGARSHASLSVGLGRLELRRASPPLPPLLEGSLSSLQPLEWQLGGHGSPERERALTYLRHWHYLGCNRPVGTHLVYVVRDAQGRDLAVHLVGAAAWQCAPRDRYIGWSAASAPRACTGLAITAVF